jgi:hypothetical protein
MNQKIADLYKENEVNPLAGCLPSFLQIPIFIGLYRAVLTLAKDGALDEPFLFLPSLEGPTYGADPTHGSRLDPQRMGERRFRPWGWEQTGCLHGSSLSFWSCLSSSPWSSCNLNLVLMAQNQSRPSF